MEKHYSEQELNILARETREAYKNKHLETCLQCRSRFLFLRQFNAALDEELKRDVDPRIERFASGLASANVIELSPYQAESDLSRFGLTEHTLVLAAKGVESERGPVFTGSIYASSSAGVIVRVVHNQNRKSHTLYVLSGAGDLRTYVVVVAGNAAELTRAAVTDANGMAVFANSDGIDWNQAVLTIRTPLAKIPLDITSNDMEYCSPENPQVRVFTRPESITVTLESPLARKVSYAVAILQNGNTIMQTMTCHKVVMGIPKDCRATELRLY